MTNDSVNILINQLDRIEKSIDFIREDMKQASIISNNNTLKIVENKTKLQNHEKDIQRIFVGLETILSNQEQQTHEISEMGITLYGDKNKRITGIKYKIDFIWDKKIWFSGILLVITAIIMLMKNILFNIVKGAL